VRYRWPHPRPEHFLSSLLETRHGATVSNPTSKIKVRFSGSRAHERVIPNPAVWALSQLLFSWDLGTLGSFPAGCALFCAVRSCPPLLGQVVDPMRPVCVSAKIAGFHCAAERCPSGLRSTLGKRV